MTPLDQRRQDAIAEAVEALLDVATERHYERVAEETFIQCHLCGEWEDHQPHCPVPALTAWFNVTGYTFTVPPSKAGRDTPATEAR